MNLFQILTFDYRKSCVLYANGFRIQIELELKQYFSLQDALVQNFCPELQEIKENNAYILDLARRKPWTTPTNNIYSVGQKRK